MCVSRDNLAASTLVTVRCMQPELGENGWTSRTTRVSDEHVLVKSDYDRDDEATILLELLPDKPCLIVPSTLTSGVEGRFELRCVPARLM